MGIRFEGEESMHKRDVDSLLKLVVWTKWHLKWKNCKESSRSRTNFNALAQGYTSDVIARAFDRLGIQN